MCSSVKKLVENNSKEELISKLDQVLVDEDIASLDFYDNVLVHTKNLIDLNNKYMARYKKPFDERVITDLAKKGYLIFNYLEIDGDYVVFCLNLTSKSIDIINRLI